jgi:hypothetical protein
MKYVECGLVGSGALLLALACSGEDTTELSGQERAVLQADPGLGSGVPDAPSGELPNAVPEAPPETEPAGPTLPAGPVGPPESIFEREHLIEVRVEMSLEDWEALSFEGIGMREILFPETGFRQVPPYTRFTASVSVDGVPYENVSIRKKGYIGSLSVIRPSLKLDFSRNFELPLAGGMRRMTLNNDLQDPSHVKQCLSYDLFTEIGLPASRCNYAHVVVNGVDLGTYSHVEDVAKPMLARHFEDTDGNLYEGELADFNAETAEYLELQTNEEENERSDVQAVIDALGASDDQLVLALGRVVDLDNFFDFWALETLLGHWDGYASNANNYFAYHDPTTDRFFFIPWGTDQSFVGDNPNDARPYDVSVYAAGAIANRLYALPEQRARYRTRLGQLADELWQVPTLLTRVEQLSRLAVRSSPAELTRLRNYVRNHGEDVRAALQRPAPEWPETPPAQPGDACQGSAGALSGVFTTQWGNIDDVQALSANGSPEFDVSIEIDGAPFAGAFRGRAGETTFTPGAATLRMVAPRPDGFFVMVELNMPLELFEPGYHPLHSFESYGDFGMFHPAIGGPFRFGRIGDGAVQLDRVSMEPGGTVSGSFEGIINYFLCTDTLTSFFAPPPAESAPVIDADTGDAEELDETAASEDATEDLDVADTSELQASVEESE